MKRCTTTGLLLLFIGAMIALAGEPSKTSVIKDRTVQPVTGVKAPAKAEHLDEVIYIEDRENGADGRVDVFPVEMMPTWRDDKRQVMDGHLDDTILITDNFEGGYPAWTSADLSAGTYWHLDDTLTFGGVGLSWWCADPCLAVPGYAGGYNNHWLQYLISDTMNFTSASAPRLVFKARWKSEVPGGEPAPYDLWDSWNVWASRNGGVTWSVLTPVSPAYTGQNSYAFGVEWGMGPGIPAYGGTGHANAFTDCIFDLSSLNGNDSVLVRWAFCSDPAWCSVDNPSFYGLIIDSIRIMDGVNTLFSNDGSLGEMALGTGPTAPDVWVYGNSTYHSPTHCWTAAMPVFNSSRGLYSHPITLPTGGGQLSIRYWVWCDMLDYDGNGDNSLEDYYYVMIAEDDPCGRFAMIVYDYGYDNGEVAPGGNSLLGWVQRTGGLISGGISQPSIDITAYAGQTVRIAFCQITDDNDDGGVGTGLHVDDVEVVSTSGFPNDMSCYSLQVRFPTNVEHPARGIAYFRNNGSLSQSGVIAWWKQQGGAALRFLPNLILAPGESEMRAFTWTPASAGTKTVLAWTALAEDEDFSNDTSSCPDIDVRGASASLELGYDNRTVQWRFNYATGEGALTRFTPAADTIGLPLDLNAIRMQFDAGQLGAQDIGLRIFEDQEGAPGELIHSATVTVTPPGDVSPNWKEVSLAGVPEVQGMGGDFWVWLEVLSTEPTQRYPQILGDNAEPWDNHEHFYTYSGGTPNDQPNFYMVRALVTSRVAADVKELPPMNYALDQNYPNPFNPITEIRYSIPRVEKVSLRVFNLLGEEVVSLVDGTQSAGTHKVKFDASNLPSGIYIYKLQTSGYSASKKMVLMK